MINTSPFFPTHFLPSPLAPSLDHPALLTFRFWLMQQHGRFIWASGAAIIIFRFELSLLLGWVLLMEVGRRRLGLGRALGHILPAGVLWLGGLLYVGTEYIYIPGLDFRF